MPEPQERPCIILDGLRFDWTQQEMAEAVEMWQAGASLPEMVDRLNPYSEGAGYSDRADEVALLLMHLGREGRIDRREGGITVT